MSHSARTNASALPDEELAQRVTSETVAFATLYERYRKKIHRYVRGQVPDHATAEDLTAQIFIKSLTAASGFRADGSYKSWIFQIARNTVATWKMAQQRSEIPIEEVFEDSEPVETAPARLPTDERVVVLQTVAELPAAQREVVLLRYWKELTVEEIAHRTRRSAGAVRQLLHRARNRMRKKLTTKDLGAIAGAAGATGASALAFYSIKKHRRKKK
jgi:RNA polymerase sigma-70 factor (ECF subfamily)